MEIRNADENDIFDVLSLAQKFHKEVGHEIPFDRNHLRGMLENFVRSDPLTYSVQVAIKDDEPIGFIVASVGTSLFSPSKIATAYGLYLRPNHRDYPNASKLMRALKEWSVVAGCEFTVVADQTNFRDLETLYKRKGFSLVERAYMEKH